MALPCSVDLMDDNQWPAKKKKKKKKRKINKYKELVVSIFIFLFTQSADFSRFLWMANCCLVCAFIFLFASVCSIIVRAVLYDLY